MAFLNAIASDDPCALMTGIEIPISGAKNSAISALVLTEVLLTGLVGAVIGYFVGFGFAQIIGQTVFGSTIEIARMVILIIGVILFFVTLLGSVPAIRYLMALKPTEVLHGK